MLKKMLTVLLGGMLFAAAQGAELTYTKYNISYGNTRIGLYNGSFYVTDKKEGYIYSVYPHYTTNGKGKWFSFAARACGVKQLPAENKSWKFVSNVPVSASAKMTVTEEIALTPFNSLDVTVKREKIAREADLQEQGVFISIPLKKMGAKQSILLNGKALAVKNETRYGWYRAELENPSFTLYPGVKGREMVVAFPGKTSVTIGTVKDGAVTIRVVMKQNPMRFTLTPE